MAFSKAQCDELLGRGCPPGWLTEYQQLSQQAETPERDFGCLGTADIARSKELDRLLAKLAHFTNS